MQLTVVNVEQSYQLYYFGQEPFVAPLIIELNDVLEHLMPQYSGVTLLYFFSKCSQCSHKLCKFIYYFFVSGFTFLHDLFCSLPGYFREEFLTILTFLVLNKLFTKLFYEKAASTK